MPDSRHKGISMPSLDELRKEEYPQQQLHTQDFQIKDTIKVLSGSHIYFAKKKGELKQQFEPQQVILALMKVEHFQ